MRKREDLVKALEAGRGIAMADGTVVTDEKELDAALGSQAKQDKPAAAATSAAAASAPAGKKD